jgi:hypothetical protein
MPTLAAVTVSISIAHFAYQSATANRRRASGADRTHASRQHWMKISGAKRVSAPICRPMTT